MNTVIIHYGEIGLKGKNQSDFITQLRHNIARKLQLAGLHLPAKKAHSYLYIELAQENIDLEKIYQTLSEVAGIAWYASARQLSTCDREIGAIDVELLELAQAQYQPGKTFAVRVNRADKNFSGSSKELEIKLGRVLQEKTDWQKVDLDKPDKIFYLDIYPSGSAVESLVYIHTEKFRGMGGLPVGTAGRVLCLLSGGIDSPVAVYYLARRGAEVDLVHFTATPPQQLKPAEYKLFKLAAQISKFTMKSKLYLLPYDYFNLAIANKKSDFELIMFRRFMVRVAEKLASEIQAEALVTGDNLAQVASQTLPNIVSASRAVQLPILRPLLGFDKNEIVALAKKIGTFEISIEPYKDCCSLIERSPKTKSKDAELVELERELLTNYDELVEKTLADKVVFEFEGGQQIN